MVEMVAKSTTTTKAVVVVVVVIVVVTMSVSATTAMAKERKDISHANEFKRMSLS